MFQGVKRLRGDISPSCRAQRIETGTGGVKLAEFTLPLSTATTDGSQPPAICHESHHRVGNSNHRSGSTLPFAPGFWDREAPSVVPPIPVMPTINRHNGVSCQ
jgi:hypothetical protein